MTRQDNQTGGYTPFPDYVLDEIMPQLTPNGWRLFCFVWRKTVGWQKTSDYISYSQIADGVGMVSKSTISSSIKDISRFVTVESAKGRSNLCRFDITNLLKGTETVLFSEEEKGTEIEPKGTETVPIEEKKGTVFDIKGTETVHTINTHTIDINNNYNNARARKEFEEYFIKNYGKKRLADTIALMQYHAVEVKAPIPDTFKALKAHGEGAYQILRLVDFDLGKAKPLVTKSISFNRDNGYKFSEPANVVNTCRTMLVESKNGVKPHGQQRNPSGPGAAHAASGRTKKGKRAAPLSRADRLANERSGKNVLARSQREG